MPTPAFKRPESVLVVVHTDDQVLLMERCSPEGFWQSVTGSLREDESPLDCAERELAEETGFAAGDLRDLSAIDTRRAMLSGPAVAVISLADGKVLWRSAALGIG